jgi:CheY-like chemotaxis protein
MSENIKKNEEMEKYEKETGRKAIWRGEITKGFEKWKEGEKDYYSGKKRISVYITGETERKWLEFIEEQDISSLSKLIRQGINYYIEKKSDLIERNLPKFTHVLKERLTTIKGNLQLIIENYSTDLNDNILMIINNLLDETKLFENEFIVKLDEKVSRPAQYDVLLIDDSISTVNLIETYFNTKGYEIKSFYTGLKGLEELSFNVPKLILLDIILPDISGFEICKQIKSNKKLEKIPIIYITAVPGPRVEEKIEETKADGYILKPFDLMDLDILFEYL